MLSLSEVERSSSASKEEEWDLYERYERLALFEEKARCGSGGRGIRGTILTAAYQQCVVSIVRSRGSDQTLDL